MKLPNADYALIAEMHTYRRPARSKTEQAFIEKFISPLGTDVDGYGNHIRIVGEAPPTILWSSHTDSVHGGAGMQNISFDAVRHEIFLPKGTKSSCLGADCAAGVWLMSEMIKAAVPGLYVFHRDEEIGHLGATHIAKAGAGEGTLLHGIRSAVAFDRKGNDSIITHMSGERTCSNAFAKSMADQLGMDYLDDDTGAWTDTYAYRAIVPECTNLSIGYANAHSPNEMLNMAHLVVLRDVMVKFDATKLVIERDPKVVERKTYGAKSPSGSSPFPGWSGLGKTGFTEPSTVYELVRDSPSMVARLLEASGMTFSMLDSAITLMRVNFTPKMLDQANDAHLAMDEVTDTLAGLAEMDDMPDEPPGLGQFDLLPEPAKARIMEQNSAFFDPDDFDDDTDNFRLAS